MTPPRVPKTLMRLPTQAITASCALTKSSDIVRLKQSRREGPAFPTFSAASSALPLLVRGRWTLRPALPERRYSQQPVLVRERFVQAEPGWAVLHDPEGHNVLLLQSAKSR